MKNSVRTISAAAAGTLVDLLRIRAVENGDRIAYTILADGETVTERMTYADLDRRARAIGAQLRTMGEPGDRVLILYPSGLDFITTFYGCLYAGMVAVPAYPPRSNKHAGRLRAIAQDCAAALVAAPRAVHDQLAAIQPETTSIATDETPSDRADDWVRPRTLQPGDLAFLQYTSGSTGTPKGVLLTHANLLHNVDLMVHAMAHGPDPVFVSWLPLHHDMGLIGNVLQALHGAAEVVYLPPEAFLAAPIRWLRALSTFGGTFSAAPNFAYELCLKKTSAADRAGLDLSRWQIALNGAEPIRAETVTAFEEAFAPYGYRPAAAYPAYGMAETAVFAAGNPAGSGARILHVDAEELAQHRIRFVPSGGRALVACGHTYPGHQLRVVDPVGRVTVGAHTIGEIWLSGPSVGLGYWNRPDVSAATFGNRLPDDAATEWLRTGDLGFLTEDGDLVVTGRIKDLIVHRGRNIYPQDIERAVEAVDARLRPGCGAAFAVDSDGAERLVVVQEVRDTEIDVTATGPAVAAAVMEDAEIPLHTLVLIRSGKIPKTSSGKIARDATRQQYLAQTLDVVATWAPLTAATTARLDSGTVAEHIATAIADQLGLPVAAIDPEMHIAAYGLDSTGSVAVAAALRKQLARAVPSTLLYHYPSVHRAAQFLSGTSSIELRPRTETDAEEPIAVVGMACRFPGADTIAAFWQLLVEGRSGITRSNRWGTEVRVDPEGSAPGTIRSDRGGFLDRVGDFDPEFFGIATAEAKAMDPQQRLVLEVAWAALEDAGIRPGALAGSRTGVYVGISSSEYMRLTAGAPTALNAYYGTGNALSVAANRLSYLLDLRGPSVAVDTACSSSLVAAHQACESMRRGESELALVAGVNLILTPDLTAVFSRARMLAPDGECKSFDAAADGYVRGEGCGVVVLKPLSRARADGDTVYALLAGSAVNQDGRSNGLTAPHGAAQQDVLHRAWAAAGVRARDIGYIESHGTGTRLGDPIEYESLTTALYSGSGRTDPCYLGAVKSNIGHLESAAGIAGLIKTVLVQHHRLVPPNRNFSTPNPDIADLDSPLVIPVEPAEFPAGAEYAGVSAFGFGGTNAHVVVGPASVVPSPADVVPDTPQILTISAHTPAALEDLTAAYAALLEDDSVSLADICHSARTTRTELPHRLALTADSAQQAREALRTKGSGVRHGRAGSRIPVTAFLFSGQGAHRPGMGGDLYQPWPAYRDAVDECRQLMTEQLGFDLLTVLDDAEALSRTEFAQPATFALQYGLVALWRSMGVEPAYLLGHSVGEFAAAVAAGMLELPDAVRIVGTRARLMQAIEPPGTMLAVRATADRVRTLLAELAIDIDIAALNAPDEVVLSGADEALDAAAEILSERRIPARRVRTSHAFHSRLMDPILDEFRTVVTGAQWRAPRIPIIAALTGEFDESRMATPEYWVEQLRHTVRYAPAVEALLAAGCEVGVEIGPHAVLAPLAARVAKRADRAATWVPSLRRGRPDASAISDALGAAWATGLRVDWQRLPDAARGQRVQLPHYPFQRRRLWLPDELAPVTRANPHGHPLLGERLPAQAHAPDRHVWQSTLARSTVAVLDDHRIQGQVVAPGTSYIELAMAAGRELDPGTDRVLRRIRYHNVLRISAEGPQIVQVSLAGTTTGAIEFAVHSRAAQDAPDAAWVLHATAELTPASDPGLHERKAS